MPTGDFGPLLIPYDLVIVDQDAGAPLPDGGRAGALLVAEGTDLVGWFGDDFTRVLATDSRWTDPVDALELPDRSWLVLESKWAPGSDDARGAIFRIPRLGNPLQFGPAELWWTDSRTRQPVCFVRDAEGTVFVSDRDADPLGVRAAETGRQRTGCVFGIEVGPDGTPARTEVVAAGPEFFTPGALLATGPLLLLMDADANPRGLRAPDGRPATPGVLFDLVRSPGTDRLARRRADVLLESEVTTSPVGLIDRNVHQAIHDNWPMQLAGGPITHPPQVPVPPAEWAGLGADDPLPAWLPELYLVDANYSTEAARLGDGAVFWIQLGAAEPPARTAHGLAARLRLMTAAPPLPPRSLVDPAYGCALPDGRLAIADANADSLHAGADSTGKGVYGTGPGAIFAWTPGEPEPLELLLASKLFVTPVAVRVANIVQFR